MAFPTTPLDVKTEIQLNGVWTDVTAKTYTRSLVTVTRGRQDESSRAQPGKASLVLNNRDGRFSPRNPTGPYYGTIGRNTPARVSVLMGSRRLTTSGSSSVYAASTPDSAALSIAGDLDLRVDLNLPSWPLLRLIGKADSAGQSSYRLSTLTNNYLSLIWSADGTNELSATSTVSLPQSSGRQAVRATIDVDNGAAGRTITFYTAPTLGGTWTQLGDPVVQAGVTSIFDSTSTVGVLRSTTGFVYGAQVYQGIGGTLRASPDFTAQAEGATSFADAQGNTWTAGGTATITARRYRFYGEISSWPQSWDISGNDVWTSVEAAGILRRVAAATDPLRGPIYRAATTDSNNRAYWPMEDESGATSMGSGLTGSPVLTFSGTPTLASDDSFQASNALPVVANATFTGAVNAYTSTNIIHVHWLMKVPAAGEVDGAVIMRLFATGTAARWDFVYAAAGGGGLSLLAYDSTGTNILSTGAGFAVNGKQLGGVLELVQNGANIDWKMLTVAVDGVSGFQFTGTLNTRTVGAVTMVQLNANALLASTVLGHLTVASAVPTSLEPPLRGYIGETAGRRVERLCSENSIAFTAYGDLDQSVAMGTQKPLSLPELLAQCETADMGQIFESREQLGLAYRTRDSRQYQGAALPLAYGNLSELVPVEDDQGTKNDVTVSRVNGSSARVTVDSGALSTQAPPNGVGRYADTIDVNLYLDSQLGDQAQWRATEGTVDEARYPTVVVNLERSPFTSSTTLTDGALSVEHGDLITISNPPAWLPPDKIKQHTIGQVETLGVTEYDIAFVCESTIPAGATGLYDDGATRYAPSGSTLTSSVTSTATGAAAISITTAAGNPLWTTAAADFPMDIRIGGEVITLSAIVGAASPQTGTVSSRSVNGVIKAQSAGSAIDISDPVYYSL